MSKEHNLTQSRFCVLSSHCPWIRQGRQHGRTVPAPRPESLARTPKWGGFVVPPTLVPHRASQNLGPSHLEFVSKPCSSSTLSAQNSCFLSFCPKSTPAHVFLYLFCLPDCAPKPPVCHRPELLRASVPHPHLPSLPSSLLSGSGPTTVSLHSESLHPYPLPTSALLGAQMFCLC